VLPSATEEADEPESLGAINLASREKLDKNLIFVINCNPAAGLDGPVRGNGKIIQELEAGIPRLGLERHQGSSGGVTGTRCWPPMVDGKLVHRMGEVIGRTIPENMSSKSGAYIREDFFFGKDPDLLAMVAHLFGRQIEKAQSRAAHDPQKGLPRPYEAAVNHNRALRRLSPGQDDQGVTGWGRAAKGEIRPHQEKKTQCRRSCGEFPARDSESPFSDDEVADTSPFYKPADENARKCST